MQTLSRAWKELFLPTKCLQRWKHARRVRFSRTRASNPTACRKTCDRSPRRDGNGSIIEPKLKLVPSQKWAPLIERRARVRNNRGRGADKRLRTHTRAHTATVRTTSCTTPRDSYVIRRTALWQSTTLMFPWGLLRGTIKSKRSIRVGGRGRRC